MLKISAIKFDLDHILKHTAGIWEHIRGRRLFISGGTGFLGCWLLESFACANEKLELEASVTVLSRDITGFRAKAPHLASNPAISFHIGDIRNFVFPTGRFDYIIHAAATSAEATFRGESPLEKFDNVVTGTRRILDFAVQCGAQKLLYTSSGAVYGRQPDEMGHIPESYLGAPPSFETRSAWGESKRAAEFLCACYAEKYGFDVTIARCFSFVGPYLQMDIHYAIGNFIRDGLNGVPIRVNGDGTPYRSYLYAADLTVWLWTILLRGESCIAYNVGAEEEISIAELAHIVAHSFPEPIEVLIACEPDLSRPPSRYVPSTKRAREQLGLSVGIDLKDAIRRTIAWYGQCTA